MWRQGLEKGEGERRRRWDGLTWWVFGSWLQWTRGLGKLGSHHPSCVVTSLLLQTSYLAGIALGLGHTGGPVLARLGLTGVRIILA